MIQSECPYDQNNSTASIRYCLHKILPEASDNILLNEIVKTFWL